jgi:uncharacterized protein
MADWGVLRWIAAKVFTLPPRQSRRIDVVKDMPVTMRDGVVLLADHHYARDQASGPVVLMRSPYGRGALFGVMAGLFAERGLQVVIQSVRGTGGSDGTCDPMRQEKADGADTLDWVRAQPWFSGQLFTFGPSYLGHVQWAMASEAADKMDGLALLVTLSNFRDELHSFGGATQAGMLSWTHLMQPMVNFVPGQRMQRPKVDALNHVHGHLPLGSLDQAAFGKTVPWWQDWVNHDNPEDPWWHAIDHSAAVAAVTAPTTMVAGWQDIFLPFQIKDFEARQTAGRETWLTIGPWSHASLAGMFAGLKQAIVLFSAMGAGRQPYADRNRVRLYLQGADIWRDFPSWPPPGSQPMRFHLHSGGSLELSPPTGDEGSSIYIYDPADPTPAVHGPKVMGMAKRRYMTELEQRSDVVLFTSAPLDRDLDVIGPVAAELAVRSDREHTDFYACLSDVDAKGRSLQVVDGYVRLRPGKPAADASGVRRITIECWPTAYRFKRGHRMRLIIGSGAHPRYARNLGTGEPLATATEMVSAHQQILHGTTHGSVVSLLVSGMTAADRREVAAFVPLLLAVAQALPRVLHRHLAHVHRHLRRAGVRVAGVDHLTAAGHLLWARARDLPADPAPLGLVIRHLARTLGIRPARQRPARVLDVVCGDALRRRHRRQLHRHGGHLHLHRRFPLPFAHETVRDDGRDGHSACE